MNENEVVRQKNDLVINVDSFLLSCQTYEEKVKHDSLEIFVVTKGALDIYDNNSKYTIKENELYIVNVLNEHSVIANQECEITQGYNILINKRFLEETIVDIDTIEFNQPNKQVNDIVYRSLLEVITHYHQNDAYLSVYIKGMICIILYIFLDGLSKRKENKQKKCKKKILDIINYIEQHYKEDISFDEVALLHKMSPGHFYKIFKIQLGTTPKEFLTNCRLTHIAMDLINTDNKIIDIAFEHGFTNVKSFYTLFKREYGMQPKEYRNSRKNIL